MAEGVIFTGGLAERTVDATDWVERHAGRHGYDPATPPGVEPVFCRVTSGTPSGGLYPGVVEVWSATTGTWTTFGAVKMKGANHEMLVETHRYICRPGGQTAGGDQVYVAASLPLFLHGVLDNDLVSLGTATMSIYSGSATDTGLDIEVFGWHVPHVLYAGLFIYAMLDRDGQYSAIAPATRIARGTLTSSLAGPSGSASVTLSYGGPSITAYAHTLGGATIPSGKKVIVWYDTSDAYWYVIGWEA